MRAWRRAFHREPELANQEHRTRRKIIAALRQLRIPYRTFDGSTGVVGLVGGERSGPVVALRADMDALPVTEATSLPYRSRYPGRMHACGHDVHMSCLLGAAAMLQRARASLGGPVKLVFQPAEEEGQTGGAQPLLERGAFDDPPVDFVVGQHVAAEIPLGSIGWRRGAFMAAADHFVLTVHGTGGHAAFPLGGPDAIAVASEVVRGLLSLVSGARDPLDPVVISVGSIHGGTRHNIIPDDVRIEGTVRTLRGSTRRDIERRVRRRVRHLAESLGASVDIEYRRGYPVTVNSARATDRVVAALAAELGAEHLVELERPVMGSEDFSRYLERVPGTFLFLGVGRPETRTTSPHSSRFAPPDPALATGATVLATAAAGLQAA